MPTTYLRPVDAFLGQTERILRRGHLVTRRTDPSWELVAESFTIEQPLDRCIATPHRNNNIAATIAETLWVLAGRNDIAFLAPYLPRASDYSDDGETWRGGYGPRLRHHFHGDQVDRVRQLLLEDLMTRRAVVSLFDPAVDYQPSKDVPCNNWLQFICIDDRLDLSITARSLDLMWGFSGINAFEWSVLHELMASWVGLQVGHQHWFVGSCHLYDRHHERAQKIVANAVEQPPDQRRIAYHGSWNSLETDLHAWFGVEDQLRSGHDLSCPEITSVVKEPLLQSFAVCVAGYWDIRNGRSASGRIEWLAGTDLARALAHVASWI